MRRVRVLFATVVLALTATACSSSGGFDCPITVPFAPGFVPPERWPAEPAEPGSEWYGTADLWTVLALDGSYTPRKSVWWSANYTDPGADPFPEIEVVWHRLDTETEDITNDGLGTNGSTADDGLFIIAGLDPNRSGCWKVTATYGDASLSYVYEKLPG